MVFRNITFINAYTEGFGGAISIETGHVSVDNCIFINNTAGVNAGGISNYGTEEEKGYLFKYLTKTDIKNIDTLKQIEIWLNSKK